MPGQLPAADVEFFNKQGYLLRNQPVFSPDKFDALRTHFETMLQRWTNAGLSPEHMDTPHFGDVKLFDWLLDDEVLDLVESLIGPDIALWSSHFICKPAGVGKRVPWHEDSAYWRGRLDPMNVVTIWLAIDPSTPENGCMRVIPGTHRNGFSDYDPVSDPERQVFASEIRSDQFDESQAVDMVLRPNECSVHEAKLIHGSHANTGDIRRCGYTMRYMPTTVKLLENAGSRSDHFEIYLARGKDRAGNNYGDPTKPNTRFLEKLSPEHAQVFAEA